MSPPPQVTVGLVSSCVGATGIEQWSSPVALSKCASHWPTGPGGVKPGNLSNCIANTALAPPFESTGPWCSGLWDLMIRPLAPMAISAILFFQGENNVCQAEWDGTRSAECAAPYGGMRVHSHSQTQTH